MTGRADRWRAKHDKTRLHTFSGAKARPEVLAVRLSHSPSVATPSLPKQQQQQRQSFYWKYYAIHEQEQKQQQVKDKEEEGQ